MNKRDLESKFPEYGLINKRDDSNKWIIPEYLPWEIGFIWVDEDEQLIIYEDIRTPYGCAPGWICYLRNGLDDYQDNFQMADYFFAHQLLINEEGDIQPAINRILNFLITDLIEETYSYFGWDIDEVINGDHPIIKQFAKALLSEGHKDWS